MRFIDYVDLCVYVYIYIYVYVYMYMCQNQVKDFLPPLNIKISQ